MHTGESGYVTCVNGGACPFLHPLLLNRTYQIGKNEIHAQMSIKFFFETDLKGDKGNA
jgi:hypothetical protein